MRCSTTVAKRWRLVLSYEKLGNFKQVARKHKCSVKMVKKWVQRHKLTHDVQDRGRLGRPSKLSANNLTLVRLLEDGIRRGLACPILANRVRDAMGIDASPETVRRFVRQHIGRRMKPRKKPTLTDKHKADRLQFCVDMQRMYGDSPWEDTAISDSKYFWLCSRGPGDKVWVIYGEDPPTVASETHSFKVHAYAVVTKYGKSPLFFTVGTTGMNADSKGVNASVYLGLLKEKLIPAARELMRPRVPHTTRSRTNAHWVWQQDNAKAHTAKMVKRWLSEQEDFKVLQWPSKSPDLSWIENVWGWVAKKVNSRPGLTPENFRQAVQEEWDNMPHETLTKFYSSIPNRVQACIDAQGGITKY